MKKKMQEQMQIKGSGDCRRECSRNEMSSIQRMENKVRANLESQDGGDLFH